MKLGSVTKFDKKNTVASRKLDDDAYRLMMTSLSLSIFWLIWSNPAASIQTHGLLTSPKLRKSRYYKVYFLNLHMCVYLHTKVHVSSMILTSYRHGNFSQPSTTAKQTLQMHTQIRVKQLQLNDLLSQLNKLANIF